MSLLFVASSSQYLDNGTPPSVSFPWAMGCWFYITDTSHDGVLLSLSDGAGGRLELRFVTTDTLVAEHFDGANSRTSTITGVSVNTWHYGLVQFVSATDVRVYLDGTVGSAGGAGTPSFTETQIDIGRRDEGGSEDYADARIAEVAVWDLSSALTSNEISSLANGYESRFVRFSELEHLWPHLLDIDPTEDIVGSLNLTQNNGPTSADHPPILRGASPFAHTAEPGAIYNLQVATSISFTQQVNRIHELDASNLITFLQAAWDNIVRKTLTDNVIFTNQVTENKVLNISLTTQVYFDQKAQRTIEPTLDVTAVTFTQRSDRGENPTNNPIFTVTASGEVSTGISNNLTFTNLVTAALELGVAASNLITFVNDVVGVIDNNCNLYEYAPFGAGLDAPPTLTKRDTIVFNYSVNTIEIRNPEFGDTILVDPRRVLNRSRKGTLNVYRRTIWPKTREFNITVRALEETEKDAILAFLLVSLGQEVTYTDPEDRDWTGIILNPNTSLRQLGECNYSLDLTFRGVPV